MKSEVLREPGASSEIRGRPMRRIVDLSVRLVERWLPDPYVLVLLLTLMVVAAGTLIQGQSLPKMVEYWGKGFWSLLTFAMQMILVLITGYALARTPFIAGVLRSVSRLATSPRKAIALVTLVSLAGAWINWGFGLVIGAIFARQLARSVPGVHYPLLIASAYSGYLVWHGGISGAIPLFLASKGTFTGGQIIPVSETVFSSFNLFIVVALVLVIPLINVLMAGDQSRAVTIEENGVGEEMEVPRRPIETPADRLNGSWILSQLVGVIGVVFIGYYFYVNNGQFDFNILIFIFLVLAIILHGRPTNFLFHVNEGVKGTAGIAIQFPFYAGIMGMIVHSGLAATLSNVFVGISNETTFPLLTFLSAGIVNIFVPSGGGQWAVQGPIMLEAAQSLGASTARTAMAVAWGDAWTNMIQPFWALPVLAIAGLSAKDIMGYCLIVLFVSGAIIGVGLTFIP